MNNGVLRRVLNQEHAGGDSSIVWNAFIDLIATEPYEVLSPLQRVAHLAFWYDSEVQNGGHLQYFENSSGVHAEETVAALDTLGAERQAALLRSASVRWRDTERKPPSNSDEYVHEALEDEFADLDAAYSSSVPAITTLLEAFLAAHQREFVRYEPAG